ncbi:alpha-D-xyloside xylohydrolase [Streptomyces sp. KhCrAH-43]|uniref:alpha-xylosidase n=1 Tax=unclassified Streptomyces TaxID=2593676 RepID=UPI000362FE78|nr:MULTISPECIES: alpha-xylosidase [unclassified Streptomyces]MYS39476.1 alpha-xylosidase [Streptomyces sp. SID4920]MYX69791.1 alpha-xylosidase [Streptomyces sp. SID8373]RAJ59730.1 alpha-D-xyloside xylohydrolase [Streptomyces sp. KhCrAH-43]
MKFTDGFWQMRDGVHASYATELRDLRLDGGGLTAYAAVQRVTRRGDTLNAPLITVEAYAPAEGVIGVRVTHLAGRRHPGPDFALPGATGDPRAATREDGAAAELTSGPLTLRVPTDGGFGLEFRDADGRLLTAAGRKGTAFATTGDGTHHMVAQLALGVGENVYGLGERFTPYVKNGQAVDMWQADGGTSSEQAYKNVPFYLSSRGYGVFVNHPGKVSFEVGSEAVGQVQFSVEDQTLEYFVVAGPTPKDVLSRYTALTGRPALPPAWSFGLWLTTSFTTSYDEATVTSFVDGMAERGIPLSVFHFDCFWMREYQWCDFEWDPAVFPDPEGMLARLKERGLRICVWINPYIAQKSPLYAEGAARGYFVRTPDGDVWQWDKWQAGMALVDFTSPEATAWFQGKLRTLLGQGVDGFKTDFGERIPTDVVWHDGSDPERMHNYYTHLYNKAVFDLLEKERGQGEAVLFARSATAGGQQFPVHWGGDCWSSFEAMAESLRGGLSLSLSGFGFWSHDIGGFEGTPDPAVFKRWLAFGLLSSHSRLHGSSSYRVPWEFGDEAVEVARRFTELKHRLMPYLYGAAVEAHRNGVPVMRPMLLEFPDDPAARTADRQYMLGPDLLVAPVFSEDGEVEYYVPEGTWTHLLTGETVTGPAWHRDTHGFDSLPLLVRPGAVLPLGADTSRPDGDWTDHLQLRVYAPEGTGDLHRTVTVPGLTGEPAATYEVVRTDGTLRVTADTDRPYEAVDVTGG